MDHTGVPAFLERLKGRDEVLFKSVHETLRKVMMPGKLDVKTKLLISIAVDASKGARPGVVNLAKRARQMGISDEEIQEALAVGLASANLEYISIADAAFEK